VGFLFFLLFQPLNIGSKCNNGKKKLEKKRNGSLKYTRNFTFLMCFLLYFAKYNENVDDAFYIQECKQTT